MSDEEDSVSRAITDRAAADGAFAIAFALLRVAEAIRDAGENIALAIDGLVPDPAAPLTVNGGVRRAAPGDPQPPAEEGEWE